MIHASALGRTIVVAARRIFNRKIIVIHSVHGGDAAFDLGVRIRIFVFDITPDGIGKLRVNGSDGGAAAAGLGTMLADVVGGYASYAPATLVIKAVMAVAAYFVSRLLKKAIRREKLDVLPRAVSALVGEALMVLGYFFFEGVLLGMGMGAAAGIPSNLVQAVTGIVIALVLVALLKGSKALDKIAVQW